MPSVVHIITALERGGAQRVVLECAAQLHGKSFSHYVITGDEAALGEEARQRFSRRLQIEPSLRNPVSWRDLSALFALSRRLAKLQHASDEPLIVHTHGSKAGVLGRLAAGSVPKTRIVHTVHGFGLGALGDRYRPYLLAAEKLAGAATDVMVFVNEADQAQAHAWCLASRAEKCVIRAGIPKEKYRALGGNVAERIRVRAQLGVPSEAPLVVTVANLKPQKDPLFHVRAFAAFRASEPNAHFLFLGDGPLRAESEALITTLGLEHAVHLPGFWRDAGPALAAADLFVLASAWEGLPCSVLEAHCAGLPIALRADRWADALRFADHIYRVPLHATPQELAHQMSLALAAGRCQTHFLPDEYTLDGMLEAYQALYERLVSTHASCRNGR